MAGILFDILLLPLAGWENGMEQNRTRAEVAQTMDAGKALARPNTTQNVQEIDLIALFFRLLENAVWILLVAAVCAVATALFTMYMITPTYKATSGLYVVSRQDSAINLSDLQIGSTLTNDYKEVFNNWHVQETVLQRLGLNYSYGQLKNMVSLSNPTNTRILYITATSVSPDEAKSLADTYAQVAREFIGATMDAQQPTIFMEALWPSSPSSPSLLRNTAIGFLIGFVLSCAVVTLLFIMDDRIRNQEDIDKYLQVPLLGMMPKQKTQRRS